MTAPGYAPGDPGYLTPAERWRAVGVWMLPYVCVVATILYLAWAGFVAQRDRDSLLEEIRAHRTYVTRRHDEIVRNQHLLARQHDAMMRRMHGEDASPGPAGGPPR